MNIGAYVQRALLVQAAREWLADIVFADMDGADIMDPDEVSDAAILRETERLYGGGLAQFKRDQR